MDSIIEIKVVPSSGRLLLMREKSGTLKCFLKSPPEKGKANDELIRYLAQLFGLSRDDVVILHGLTSKKKVIKVTATRSIADLLAAAGCGEQQSLV